MIAILTTRGLAGGRSLLSTRLQAPAVFVGDTCVLLDVSTSVTSGGGGGSGCDAYDTVNGRRSWRCSSRSGGGSSSSRRGQQQHRGGVAITNNSSSRRGGG